MKAYKIARYIHCACGHNNALDALTSYACPVCTDGVCYKCDYSVLNWDMFQQRNFTRKQGNNIINIWPTHKSFIKHISLCRGNPGRALQRDVVCFI